MHSKSLRPSGGISWQRLALEATAIVGSILLAFAIDAWWEERQQRADEQEILRALHGEFSAVLDVLSGHLQAHGSNVQNLERLLAAVNGQPIDDSADVVAAALEEMMAPTTSDLGNGTLDALLNSGRIEIITNRELQAGLTAWAGVIGEVWDDQHNNASLVHSHYIPFLVREHAPLSIVMRGSYPNWPESTATADERQASLNRFLQIEEFKTLSEVRYAFAQHLRQEYEAAIAAAASIIAELERSID